MDRCMTKDISKHPCFNPEVKKTMARVHIPVAPACNIQCLFCNRKYDCVNESRPGVTSAVFSPRQALLYVENMKKRVPNLSVVGVAGPGDAFAEPEKTLECLKLIHEKFPEILLCVSTNGLNAAEYVADFAAVGMSHLTVTVNAVDPEIGRNIYAWMRYKKKIYRGTEGAQLLLNNQIETVRAAVDAGLIVKINCIYIPGVNDHHVAEVARVMSQLGADLFNCMPLKPVEDTVFEDIEEPSERVIADVRKECSDYITQMFHCGRCRADAAGIIGEENNKEIVELMREISNGPLDPLSDRKYVAAATREGMLINQHLGEAEFISIYQLCEGKVVLKEKRRTPAAGTGDLRWVEFAQMCRDCSAVLVSGVGVKPKKILEERGIKVFETQGMINYAVEAVYMGRTKEILNRKCSSGCGKGITCSGSGGGCGA